MGSDRPGSRSGRADGIRSAPTCLAAVSWCRLVYGIRVSLIVAVVSNATSIVIGAAVGLFAGYFRGPVEQLLMRFTDVGLALPYTLAGLVIAAVMSAGLTRVIVIITVLFWSYPARLVYGEVLRLRSRGFVEAGEAMGAGGLTIVRRHLAPHVTSMMLAYSPLNAASAVAFEATLSYLSAGINPPTASLGNMISDGETAISYDSLLVIAPGSRSWASRWPSCSSARASRRSIPTCGDSRGSGADPQAGLRDHRGRRRRRAGVPAGVRGAR